MSVVRDDSGVSELTEGLVHLWFGYHNVSSKTFNTFASKGLSIHKASVGQKHCGFLTNHGEVYMYGNNQWGQLGSGNTEDHFDEPVFVEALKDVIVIDISCGARHTAAVTSTGHVFCWGDTTQGQCSGNQPTPITLPIKIDIFRDITSSIQTNSKTDAQISFSNRAGSKLQKSERSKSLGESYDGNNTRAKVTRQSTDVNGRHLFGGESKVFSEEQTEVKLVQVTCGGNHTVAVSEHGELWSWGTGLALGLNVTEKDQVLSPQRVEFLSGRKVLQVSCGTSHTLALVQKLPISGNFYPRENVFLKSKPLKSDLRNKATPLRRNSSLKVDTSNKETIETTCEKCHSPIQRFVGTDDDIHHTCPLGLEITNQSASKLIASKLVGSSNSRLDSQSGDTDSTCSEVDQASGAVYLTAENSPQKENLNSSDEMSNQPNQIKNLSEFQLNQIENDATTRNESIQVVIKKNHSSTEEQIDINGSESFSSQNQYTCDTQVISHDTVKCESSLNKKPDDQNVQNISENCDVTDNKHESSANSNDSVSKCGTNNDSDLLKSDFNKSDRNSAQSSVNGNMKDSANAPVMREKAAISSVNNQPQLNGLKSNNDCIENQINQNKPVESNKLDPVNNETAELKTSNQSNGPNEDEQVKGVEHLISPDGKMKVLTTRNSSESLGGIPKSRSTFLDEEEAKEFLERQLSGEDSLQPQVDEHGNLVVLAKKVENILQYVPNTSTAIAMQEYVTSWTKNAITNIKSSVETTMDRFGIVSSLGSSMDEEDAAKEQTSFVEMDKDEVPPKLEKLKDFHRAGTLPKSTSLSGEKLKSGRTPTHRRKGSLPTGAICLGTSSSVFRCSDVIMDTEVWSWGHGHQGQLGHGDLLYRSQPCKVKFFSDKKIIKVSCGAYHNVVLTANSQVYSWGSNDSGQLGHDDGNITSKPCVLEVGDGCSVFDVSAGDHHSVALADGPTGNPQVYFTGRQPGKSEGKEDSVTKYTHINSLQKVGWIKSISAGGELSACVSDKNNVSSYISVIHEFTGSERQFGTQLHFVADNILKPLLASDSFQSKDSSQLGMAVGLLCDAFMCITDMISLNHLEGSQIILGTRDVTRLQLLCKSEQCIGVYQHYCKCFTDVLSIGGFKTCAQLCSSIINKSKDQIKAVLELKSYNSKDVGNIFLKLMRFPFNRLKDYCKMLGRLVLKFPSYTSEKQVIDKCVELWEGFRQTSTVAINQADITNRFWSECYYKLAEELKVPTRRLLFDSKSHPLNLRGSGRFTSHRFLLFNDIFAHVQGSYHSTYQLSTIWLQTSSSEQDIPGNFIRLLMPEDSITVSASSPAIKSEWVWAFNQAIDRALCQQRHNVERRSGISTLSPPRDRHASYIFSKHPIFKDAKYEGMWRVGQPYGQGELQWTDGRKFIGAFKDGCQDGYGIYTIPRGEDGEKEVYEGMWRNGRLCGYGLIRYPNGDSYEGHFRDGKRHGHGTLKQGKLTSTLASIYIGEWCLDKKSGYGVYEDILKGQKYMGLWLDDQKHGNGVIVTIDGMYFEGTFQQNKMTGYGLLMTEDNSCYEGEFSGGPNLAGKGILTLPNGDFIEGSFNGSFNEGIKVNGTFYKCPEGTPVQHGFSHALGIIPKSYGKLSVPAQRKWEEVFDHCCAMLGVTKDCARTDPSKAWEKCAAFIEIGKKMSASTKRSGKIKNKQDGNMPEILETIPQYSRGQLTVEYYANIKEYVEKAFECPYHPLGKLLESLVDVYRATYVGVGAHPRLLHHAVLEVKSFIDRMYPIVRILFPDLPYGHNLVQIFRENVDKNVDFEQSGEDVCEVVTPGSLLYPLLLPKIYPPLFTLYGLYNEKADEQYWRRIVSWNKQSDLALMSYLGIDQKFWTFEDQNIESPQRLSKIRDKSYTEAVETLQGLSTSFSPADKLYLIQSTFNMINKVVQDRLGLEYLWCMDDLFPVFQYVVVRARIQHLGAEIHFMDDVMEAHLEHGELGLMFTTLKASYYQIQNEKIA